ncbi:hypothetical protein [Streptomyces sp. NRRL F-4428]|uniref:hypothetical protein n=1 Tax=Streptomyces sp. NRRL F-4428 TaxID=1609137 RepID=UPI0005EC67B6|nr:hypothetical protein [Streptomyces sp. NRRL F-4428]KJK44082.1 hypothetical protein UK14_29185 [Streptomyces sp. NRRL F-4428]
MLRRTLPLLLAALLAASGCVHIHPTPTPPAQTSPAAEPDDKPPTPVRPHAEPALPLSQPPETPPAPADTTPKAQRAPAPAHPAPVTHEDAADDARRVRPATQRKAEGQPARPRSPATPRKASVGLGEEKAATAAQDQALAELPPSLPRFATHLELHRGLMLACSGDRAGGIAHATTAMETLPPEKHSLTLRMLVNEIRA